VIRSRRVQEKMARAEGDRERPYKPMKPLCITVMLSKDEIAQDLAAITGHKRGSRPKRSNIAAMVSYPSLLVLVYCC